MKRPISTRVHGVIDYTTGAALIAAPEVLRLDGVRASSLAPRIAGAGATAYSALTDYAHGFAKRIPMRAHLALDAASGAALAASPWVLGYARHGRRHWLPHTIVGTGEILTALATKTEPPFRERARRRRSKLGAVALLALGAAALVANRDRLRGLRRSTDDASSDEPIYASIGMASSNEPEAPPPAESGGAPEAAPASETPGTTAPPL
ncbi:MAG: hypothetical protein KY396_09115 [Actinobacteria bacterium]|nr:hypothetical protein [Actinomycetota bacterium]